MHLTRINTTYKKQQQNPHPTTPSYYMISELDNDKSYQPPQNSSLHCRKSPITETACIKKLTE